MKKRWFLLLLAGLLMSAVSVGASEMQSKESQVVMQSESNAAAEVVESDSWFGVNWTKYSNGHLYIEVVGESLDSGPIPWLEYEFDGENAIQYDNEIKTVKIVSTETGNLTSMQGWFSNCENLVSVDASELDTSNVTSLYYTFENCSKLEEVLISNWDVRNVENIVGMFYGCEGLKELDLSNWKINNIHNIGGIFGQCTNLESLKLAGWDVSEVILADAAFSNCKSLKRLDLSGWNLESMQSAYEMFEECLNLEEIVLSSCDFQYLESADGMFYNCKKLKKLPDLDLPNLSDGNCMFTGCENLSTSIFIGCGTYLKQGCNRFFENAAIADGAEIYVNYSGATAQEEMGIIMDTKSENSHIYLRDIQPIEVSFHAPEKVHIEVGETYEIKMEQTPYDATGEFNIVLYKWDTVDGSDEMPIDIVLENQIMGRNTPIVGIKEGIILLELRKSYKDEWIYLTDYMLIEVGDASSCITPKKLILKQDDVKTMKIGEKIQLEVDIFPSYAADTEITYSDSGDAGTLRVDEHGLVTAVREGWGLINISAEGANDASFNVEVLPADDTTGGDTGENTDGNPDKNPSDMETPDDSEAVVLNGLHLSTDGAWYLYENGVVNDSYTGLYCDANVGWWLVVNGQIAFDYTGLWCDPVYGWWLIGNGAVAFDYTGLWCDPVYGWWLIGGGTVCFDYTGLWCDPNYGWWLIGNGAVAFDYTGLWCDPNYGWWLVGGGAVAFDYNGLWNDPNNGWWLINGGTIPFGYTGLYYDTNLGWWYIQGGAVGFGYTGEVYYDGVPYYVVSGQLRW